MITFTGEKYSVHIFLMVQNNERVLLKSFSFLSAHVEKYKNFVASVYKQLGLLLIGLGLNFSNAFIGSFLWQKKQNAYIFAYLLMKKYSKWYSFRAGELGNMNIHQF